MLVQVKLRIPRGLRSRLRLAAEKRKVTLGAEMADRLARSFTDPAMKDQIANAVYDRMAVLLRWENRRT